MKTSRAVVAIVILAGLGVLLSAPAGWAKKHPKKQKDTGRFSEQCLVDDKNLSDGATISIAPASLWPPNHKFANVAVGMNLNSDADDPVPVSFSIISITDDQAEDDDQGGHGCGQKSSKQGPDWAPTGLSDSDPLTVSGSLKKSSDVIGTDPGEVKLRRERCAKDGSRTYELEVVCCDNTDSHSPICDSEPEVLEVRVPHDRGHH